MFPEAMLAAIQMYPHTQTLHQLLSPGSCYRGPFLETEILTANAMLNLRACLALASSLCVCTDNLLGTGTLQS